MTSRKDYPIMISFLQALLLSFLLCFVLLDCTGSSPSTSKVKAQQVLRDENDPQDFIPVDKQPVPIRQVTPEYPDSAQKNHFEGIVWVKAVVGRDGTVKKAVIMQSDNHIFDNVAIQAMLQWKFTPAIMDGEPVAVWVSVPFKFKLKG
jgi:TonB family protein